MLVVLSAIITSFAMAVRTRTLSVN